jgi:hypothetical protein
MTTKVKLAFERDTKQIPLDLMLPLRQLRAFLKSGRIPRFS